MMKVFVSTLCAAVLALTPVAFSPASAGSTVSGTPSDIWFQASGPDLVQVRSGQRYQQHRRGASPRAHNRRGFNDRSRRSQPQRSHRPRQQSRGPDLGSAVVGAIVGGLIVHQFQQQPRAQAPAHHSRSYLSQSHINWCHNRWRSYRVSDNSYQPYNGPRRVCVSPYGPS